MLWPFIPFLIEPSRGPTLVDLQTALYKTTSLYSWEICFLPANAPWLPHTLIAIVSEMQLYVTAMAHLHPQLDWMWKHLGDTLSGISRRTFLGRLSWGGRIHGSIPRMGFLNWRKTGKPVVYCYSPVCSWAVAAVWPAASRSYCHSWGHPLVTLPHCDGWNPHTRRQNKFPLPAAAFCHIHEESNWGSDCLWLYYCLWLLDLAMFRVFSWLYIK